MNALCLPVYEPCPILYACWYGVHLEHPHEMNASPAGIFIPSIVNPTNRLNTHFQHSGHPMEI